LEGSNLGHVRFHIWLLASEFDYIQHQNFKLKNLFIASMIDWKSL